MSDLHPTACPHELRWLLSGRRPTDDPVPVLVTDYVLLARAFVGLVQRSESPLDEELALFQRLQPIASIRLPGEENGHG